MENKPLAIIRVLPTLIQNTHLDVAIEGWRLFCRRRHCLDPQACRSVGPTLLFRTAAVQLTQRVTPLSPCHRTNTRGQSARRLPARKEGTRMLLLGCLFVAIGLAMIASWIKD